LKKRLSPTQTKFEDDSLKTLCLNLLKAETENEVIGLLKKLGYWDNPKYWAYYGDNENNFSIIGNQQSLPETALVEKLINSVDAVLMRECLRRNINPEGEEAPKSIENAQKEFFNINQGSLWNISSARRTELAENILFVATSEKSNPCYIIIDYGEGQTPNKMPHTFLSLSKSNKLRIPFVQGKFNMGGTGVLQFCGKENLQLIISKRDPKIAIFEKEDESSDHWGFTVVRRESPREGRRSSAYTYLSINNKIPSFKAQGLSIIPGEYPEPYKNPIHWGSLIKLYEYQIPGLRTNIVFDLYNRINLLLPDVALPIRFLERRKGYTGHSMESTMSGLSVRLNEDRSKNLEEGFPTSSTINVSGNKMNCIIYVFKKDQDTNYRKEEGIVFLINGQTHGYISNIFFKRKSVGMDYLSDSILITIDCTNFSSRIIEDLFMNSRDRLRSGEMKSQIEEHLEELISKHKGLTALKEKRRREEIHNKLKDSKPLKDVLDDILKKSPSLSSLLIPGLKLKNPFDLRSVEQNKKEKYKGKQHPTYFKCIQKDIKRCPINRKFNINYETDVVNDYFKRSDLPGEFVLFINDTLVNDYIFTLWNGRATLSANLPHNAKVEDIYKYTSIIKDPVVIDSFKDSFKIEVIEPIEENNGQKQRKKIKNPPSDENGKDRQIPSDLELPRVIEIYKERWPGHNFTEKSALEVLYAGHEGYDFYVNMDNIYLLSEIKINSNVDAILLKERYKYALVLIGLALLKEFDIDENNKENVTNDILHITAKLSPVILPMISYLGDLVI